MDRIELSPVAIGHATFLYDLLKERDPDANISHREMPTWEEHVLFVCSKPYAAWYVVMGWDGPNCKNIGSIYLTKNDEIGIFFLKDYQGKGYGTRALNILMQLHPRPRYFANISPRNHGSKNFFLGQGFKHIQDTYELRAG